jgi:hypothetical protein
MKGPHTAVLSTKLAFKALSSLLISRVDGGIRECTDGSGTTKIKDSPNKKNDKRNCTCTMREFNEGEFVTRFLAERTRGES